MPRSSLSSFQWDLEGRQNASKCQVLPSLYQIICKKMGMFKREAGKGAWQKYLPRPPCSHLRWVHFHRHQSKGTLSLVRGQHWCLMPSKGIRWYLQTSWLLEMVEKLVARALWRLLAQPPPGSHLLPTLDVGDIPQAHLLLSIQPVMGLS